MDALRGMRSDFGPDKAGWARAAGNVWTEAIGGAIPKELWATLGHLEEIPPGVPVAYGAARSACGTQVAVAAAARLPDDTIVVEILDVFSPSAGRAAERVRHWADGGSVAVTRNGPSAGLASKLDTLNTKNLYALNGQEEGAAVTNFLDALPGREIRFRPHPDLDAAAEAAGTRVVGDGGQAWARVKATAPVATLEAATWAVWALDHRPVKVGKPRIITAA